MLLVPDCLFCHGFAWLSYSRMIVGVLGKYSGFIICQLPIFLLKSDDQEWRDIRVSHCISSISIPSLPTPRERICYSATLAGHY